MEQKKTEWKKKTIEGEIFFFFYSWTDKRMNNGTAIQDDNKKGL